MNGNPAKQLTQEAHDLHLLARSTDEVLKIAFFF